MKIIRENACYIQRKDLAFLQEIADCIPATIYEKVFIPNQVITVNGGNREDFIKFDQPHEINYFKDIDWMLDYDQVKDLEDVDLWIYAQNISHELHFNKGSYQRMSNDEKEKYQRLMDRCDQLEHLYYSAVTFIRAKQKELTIPYPEEILSENDGKFKKLIKSIFGFKKTNKNTNQN